ncbi:hypothetical protein [Cupriavidus consociatus]|uniref:hypothetical protein n=1 Tax=Cupriavidus consociatus TaxID=2821357 RepID=UPI001AEB99B7|nr:MULTISPECIES: hypothetical protein [unclassified Cupriavidus]MBP0624015.1 hypothetical protein [Cupriavidus sp. LEh25]MDK2660724.1 hypothetical protein [Cupriavidus sp. LEh21]
MTIAFLAVAIGQTVGVPAFGFLASRLTIGYAMGAFALVALAAGCTREWLTSEIGAAVVCGG